MKNDRILVNDSLKEVFMSAPVKYAVVKPLPQREMKILKEVSQLKRDKADTDMKRLDCQNKIKDSQNTQAECAINDKNIKQNIQVLDKNIQTLDKDNQTRDKNLQTADKNVKSADNNINSAAQQMTATIDKLISFMATQKLFLETVAPKQPERVDNPAQNLLNQVNSYIAELNSLKQRHLNGDLNVQSDLKTKQQTLTGISKDVMQLKNSLQKK